MPRITTRNDSHVDRRRGISQPRRTDWRGTYLTRVEAGLVCSLTLALGLVHLPLDHPSDVIGWFFANRTERITIDLIEAQSEPPMEELTPITSFDRGAGTEPQPEEILLPESDETEEAAGDIQNARALRAMKGLRVFEFAQEMPELIGGIGAYYINISYPQSAIEAGIEGRLVLAFVVDTLGHTRDIHVIESLSADCDSAAVRALRQTRFVPGRQNGEAVAVRMRLPVVFKLIPPAGEDEAANL